MAIHDENRDPSRKPDMTTQAGGSYAGNAGMHGTGAHPDAIDTNAEEAYWRESYATRPYVPEGTPFGEYRTAFRYGADAHTRYPGRSFDEAEAELGSEWHRFQGTSSLTWDQAKLAARDAWQRVKDTIERAMPGDSDRDAK